MKLGAGLKAGLSSFSKNNQTYSQKQEKYARDYYHGRNATIHSIYFSLVKTFTVRRQILFSHGNPSGKSSPKYLNIDTAASIHV